MKKKITGLALALLSSLSSFSQEETSMKIQQELSFQDQVGFNLASRYLSGVTAAPQGTYVVIRTNFPFESSNGMTSISVNYWGYEKSWELNAGWYVYNGIWIYPTAYCNGITDMDHVKFFEENGKVCIAIKKEAFSYYGNISVHKKVAGLSSNVDWMKNWEITDPIAIDNRNVLQTVPVDNQKTTQPLNFALSDLTLNGDRNHNLADNQITFSNGNLKVDQGSVTIKNSSPTEYMGSTANFGEAKLIFANENEFASVVGIHNPSFQGIQIGPKLSVGTPKGNQYDFSVAGASFFDGQTTFNHIATFKNTAIFNQKAVFKSSATFTEKMAVGYGTMPTMGDFMFAVDGKIGAREIEVKEGNWADYVFDENYELMPLKDVASFVEANHHMPNVPSATEVAEEGLSLGEMTRIQQEKIEELLLYILQQQKQIEELAAGLESLKQN